MRRGRRASGNSAAGAAEVTAALGSPENENTSAKILCKYVVAADGAGSSVREAAGIGLSGRQGLGNLVNIHFRCKGLGQLLLGGEGLRGQRRRQGPGMLYFVYNEVWKECERRHWVLFFFFALLCVVVVRCGALSSTALKHLS